MNKKASVAKWVALAIVPVSLAAVVAKTAWERRAEAATQQLLQGWSDCIPEMSSVEELIAQGADVNACIKSPEQKGVTPLHLAAISKSSAIDVLLDHGAQIDAQDAWGGTALMSAALSGNSDATRRLLRRGARIDLRSGSEHDQTTLSRAQLGLDLQQDSIKYRHSKHNGSIEENSYSDKIAKQKIERFREIIQLLKAAGAKE